MRMSLDGSADIVEYSRSDLSRKFGLHPRDLRFLDSSLRNLPSILSRKKVIVVNLEAFKALIAADTVLMFDSYYPHVQQIIPLIKGKSKIKIATRIQTNPLFPHLSCLVFPCGFD